jgi:predicted nucleic acid-binding protein
MERIFDVIAIASIRRGEKNVFELALKEGLTIYDAANLHYALRNKLVLVTDDIKLREKPRNSFNKGFSADIKHHMYPQEIHSCIRVGLRKL